MAKPLRDALVPFLKQRLSVTGTIKAFKVVPATVNAERQRRYMLKPDDEQLATHLWFEIDERLDIGDRVTISGIVHKYKDRRKGTTGYGINKDVKVEAREA